MNTTLNTETTPASTIASNRRRGGIVAGAVLIGVGLLSLVEALPGVNLDHFFLPLLASIFLAAGLIGRRAGLLVPGGILMGIGAYDVLESGMPYMSEMTQGGAFFLALAGGFALISLASLLIGKRVLWPLFPAAGSAAFGAMLIGGMSEARILEFSGFFWPAVLIAVGLYLMLRRR